MFKKMLVFMIIMCIMSTSVCFCENQNHETGNFADLIVDNIMAYHWEDMEVMAASLPNATIPYRGSTTVSCLNNHITCRWDENLGAFVIQGFVQTNDVFPIHWADETFIGLSYADMLNELHAICADCAGNSGYSCEITCENDGAITKLICTFMNKANEENSFSLSFGIAEDQVFEIAFDFLQE